MPVLDREMLDALAPPGPIIGSQEGRGSLQSREDSAGTSLGGNVDFRLSRFENAAREFEKSVWSNKAVPPNHREPPL